MNALLYKEWKLAKHPTVLIYLLFDLMLLIPSYPYYVVFLYTGLAVFFVFLYGRENNDLSFSVQLPVCKRDVVRARMLFVVLMELAQILVSIPIAVLGVRINPNGCNTAGIEPNAAFYGFVFGMYAVYNALYFTRFYRDPDKPGKALLPAGIALLLYIALAEGLVHAIPAWNAALDTFDPASRGIRVAILIAGLAVFAGLNLLALRRSEALFERVDL